MGEDYSLTRGDYRWIQISGQPRSKKYRTYHFELSNPVELQTPDHQKASLHKLVADTKEFIGAVRTKIGVDNVFALGQDVMSHRPAVVNWALKSRFCAGFWVTDDSAHFFLDPASSSYIASIMRNGAMTFATVDVYTEHCVEPISVMHNDKKWIMIVMSTYFGFRPLEKALLAMKNKSRMPVNPRKGVPGRRENWEDE